jgi:hypothetical protein
MLLTRCDTFPFCASSRCTVTANNVQATSLTICRLALVIAGWFDTPSLRCHQWPRQGCGGAGAGRCRRECCLQGRTSGLVVPACDTFPFLLIRAALRQWIICAVNGTHALSSCFCDCRMVERPLEALSGLNTTRLWTCWCGQVPTDMLMTRCDTFPFCASSRCTATVSNVQAKALTICRLALVIAVR